MSKTDTKIKCKNIFKHTNEEDIKKEFTDKWITVIRILEHLPQNG